MLTEKVLSWKCNFFLQSVLLIFKIFKISLSSFSEAHTISNISISTENLRIYSRIKNLLSVGLDPETSGVLV